MKISAHIPRGWGMHGLPAEEHITGITACEVLRVARVWHEPPRWWRRARAGWSHLVLLRAPAWVVPDEKSVNGSLFWTHVSKSLNPRWEPPEFPEGVDCIEICEGAPTDLLHPPTTGEAR